MDFNFIYIGISIILKDNFYTVKYDNLQQYAKHIIWKIFRV